MGSPRPTRGQGDLASMVEMLLDKGVVINADIAVSVGDTELLGVQVRAALASFETAAQYGLEFPEGTDMDRVEEAAAGQSRRGLDSGGAGGNDDTDTGSPKSSPSGPDQVALRPGSSAGEGNESSDDAAESGDDAGAGAEDEEDADAEEGAAAAATTEATEGDDGDG